MEKNVGSTDTVLRTVTGAVAGAASLAVLLGSVPLPAVLSPVLGIVATVMFVTASVGTCPIYSLFGIDSCPRDSSAS
jgi:Protein of unknown function (DUF2892).